ncbi:MAG TPA: mandelate racemase/muconate lactonizing enzyme family protein [Xanthobacteraceae bacterium]|nr:mandelate racemase/muconate lactonizing enzyme family protein [Xanthobacteraceae bacterium]
MKIVRVTATPIHVPLKITLLGLDKPAAMSCCIVEIETDTGLIGHGMTSITEQNVVAAAVDHVAGPAIIGDDPLAHEKIWDKLYWLMMPRGQTGYAAHALAAIDIALWDIKGKALGQPVWRLLGGARSRVPIYVTFGFDFFTREQLGEAAKYWAGLGFNKLKMTVGHQALKNRDRQAVMEVIREDAERVRTVREAVGPDVELFIDANCSLDFYHASKLIEMIKEYRISFFEEPITQNDALQMAQLRRQTGMALAAGQNEGLMFRFRDLLMHEAVDVVQPNAVISGGYTQCAKILALAQAFNVPAANGGAWSYHNMHLQGGLANGSLVEHHYLAVEMYKRVYRDLPEPKEGWMDLPQTPGLGFSPDLDVVRELAKEKAPVKR